MDLKLDDLAHLATWAYAVIFGFSVGDAVLPVLPSETAVILGGVLAQRGDLSAPIVVLVAALGAMIGDNISYQLGRSANRKGKHPEDMKGRLGKMLGWAEAALHSRGASMIILARFIPGGRIAITFGAGYVKYERMKFVGSTFLAGALWALYATGIGYLGGRVFEEKWWAGLLLGHANAFSVAGEIELARKLSGKSVSVAETQASLKAERSQGGD
jgi:membrane protein DedA with SNARE-associated domain